MQAVVLAGGLGTRLLPITRTVPKAMVRISGRPFLEYQLELLRTHGITDIVLCVGYLGDMIKAHFGDGSRLGLSIRYGEEGDHLLGTAGALKNVEHCLRDEFFVTYGDGYLRLDYRQAMAYFQQHDRLDLMVVHRNRDRYDRSNVVVTGAFVAAYDKTQRLHGMEYIDFGVSILRKEALQQIPPGQGHPFQRRVLIVDMDGRGPAAAAALPANVRKGCQVGRWGSHSVAVSLWKHKKAS